MNGLFASRAPHGAASARWKSFGAILLAAMLATNLAGRHAACGQVCATTNRAHDELWFVDARPAACSTQGSHEAPKLTVQRVSSDRKWRRAELAELLSADPNVQTVIWVHGNRVSRNESRQRGWEFYHTLTRQADERPVRTIIWSWPADQIRGPLQDVRYKAALSVPAAFHLARFMRHLDPATPVGLVGFSYGARVITGALHLQAGGSLGVYRLPKQAEQTGPTPRAVLWASAINDNWLLPGHYHGQAIQQLQHATFLNNSSDRALKHYRLLDRCTRPEAVGYWGLAGVHRLGDNQTKIAQKDVACLVGQTHTDGSYIFSPSIMRTTWRGLATPAAASTVAKK